MQNIFLEEFGTTIQFPDNFDDSQITSAIEKEIIPQLRLEAEEEEEARRREVKDNTSLGSAFGTGLSRGYYQTKSLLFDALPAIAADIGGADDYRDRQLEEYNQAMQRIEQDTPSAVPTFKDIESIGDASLYAAETVGQFIPSIVTSIAGGGILGFAGKKTAEKFATKMAKDAAEKAIKKGTTAGFVAGTFLGSGSQTIPEAYTTIAEETGEPNAAAGLIVGSINASLDSLLPLGLARTLPKKARQEVSSELFARLMKGAGKGAVVEGLTEGVQEANQLIASDIINENPDLLRGENVDRILEASIRGAIGGTAFGTIGGIPGESPKQRQAREYAQGREQLEKDIQAERDALKPDEQILLPAPGKLESEKTPTLKDDLRTEVEDTQRKIFFLNQKIAESKDKKETKKLKADLTKLEERLKKLDDTARTPTQTAPGTPSELTIAETLQFAEQNRGRDEQIDNILDSLTSPDKAGFAADRIRKRLAELNVGPQLARDTIAMRSGQPSDELLNQIAQDNIGGSSKGGGKGKKSQMPFEEGTLVNRPELRKARYVKKIGTTNPSYERIDKEEFDRIKANPETGVSVFENPVSIEKKDPLAPASDPILQPEEGITPPLDASSMGRPRPRLPEPSLTQEQLAEVSELEAIANEIATVGTPTAKGDADAILKPLKRMVDRNQPFAPEGLSSRIDSAKNRLAQLREREAFQKRASEGTLTEADIETDYFEKVFNQDTQEGPKIADAETQPGVAEVLNNVKDTINNLNLKINQEGFKRSDNKGITQGNKLVRDLQSAMQELGGASARLINQASGKARGYNRGNEEKFPDTIKEITDDIKKIEEQFDLKSTPPTTPTPPTPQFTGFKVKNTEIIDERTGEKRDVDMWGDIVEVSDGIETRYLAWEDPDGSTVTDPDDGWHEVDKFGNSIGGQGNLYANLPDLKRDKKQAVNMLREDMAIKSGDEMALQQLVEEGVISEQLALDNIRASAATTANQDPAIKVKSPVEVKAENVAEARARIDARLENLRTAGPQGRRLADAIVKSIFNMDLSVSQVAVAFESADILNQILPSDADQTIGFFNKLFAQKEVVERSGGEGTEVAGLNIRKTKDNINGMIELALGLDERIVKQTAAHEAFHTLQDYFSAYDKGSEGILNDFFGKPNEIVEFEKTGAAKYLRRLNRPLFNELRGKTMPAGEVAALTFQAYDAARRNGGKVPGTGGAVRRFFNFISQFFPRLGNAIRGRGFRNLDDVLRDASTGATAQRMEGLGRPQFDRTDAQGPFVDDTRASAITGVNSQNEYRVSTRYPTAGKRTEDPEASILTVGPDEITENPTILKKAAQLIRGYNVLSKKESRGGDRLIVEKFINRLTDNLLYVFDSIDPEVRERSKLWYVGANKIANDLAKEFNIQPHIAAGVIAATSPQKDWFMNASLARRIIDIKSNHMDFQFTPEMQKTADRIFKADKYQDSLDIVSGRKGRNDTSLGSLDVLQKSPILQAMWIRIYDETYNDRSHKAISPEGQFTETVLNAKGKPVKTGWGSLAEIAKGVAILDNPAIINAEMGSQNKIRSFMNNIIAPFGVFGDVTIDTHAVAAALLKPLSSKSTQVHHNFGSSPQPKDAGSDWTGGTSNSTVTGVSGLYGLYAEAYRRAAERRGVLPREMQSITWEAVRGLFPAKYKTKENVNKINNIWNRYQKGAITLDQTRQEILDASPRGFQAPAWAGPRSGATGNTRSTSNTAELSGVQLSRRDTTAVDGGTGSPATSRASAVLGVRASPKVQPIGQTGRMIDLISSGNTQGVMESIGAPFLKYFKSGRVIDDLINRFNPLAELDKMTNAGKLKDATESAFKFAELATNMSGRSEFALLHGNLVYNKTTGELDVDPNSEGLLEIFKDIGTGDNYKNFQMYAIARRAITLKQDTQRRISVLNQKIAQSKDKREKKKLKADLTKMQERQKNLDDVFTGARIADGMSYENAQFRDVFDRYNKFNQKTLQFLVDTEIISEAQKDAMSIDYIPYYRMMEEEEFGTRKGAIRNSILGPKTTNVLNNPDAGIKELTGRSGAIGDLYENIIKNNTAMISAGLKNVSMGRALKTMEQEGMATRVPSKIGQDSEFVVTYYENGNKVYMDMTDANGELTDFNHRMFMALSSFSPPQLTGLMDMVQKVTGIFRDAITLAPNFMLANLIRGDIAGYVTVDADFKPLFGTMKGFKNVITNDRVSEEMKAVAGVGGYSYGQNTQDYSRTFKRQLKPEWNAAQVLPKFINGLRTVGEASELATRDAIYRAILDKGGNKTEAGYQALNLVNFNRRGNPQTRAGQVLSLFLPMIPFLNARIQGLYRTTTALTGAEANRRKAIMRMGMLGGISMMIYMMNKDDERWDDEPLYRKMTYDIIYLGDNRLLIPKAFEVGALAQTLPQVLTEVVSGDRNSSYAADAAGHTFMNTFSFNPIPQVIKPLIEVYTNYDFFREREIESARMRNLPKEQRSATTTPETLRQLGQVTDAINLSPVQLETIIRGYLGTLGMTSIATMDTVMSQVGLIPEKPEGIMPFADIIGLNRFVREGADPANRWVGEVYDLRREANEIYSGIRALREEGRVDAARELMRDNRQLLGTRKQVNKLAQSISDITKQINRVRDSETLDASTKKSRLNTLIARRNKIAENVERILDRIGR